AGQPGQGQRLRPETGPPPPEGGPQALPRPPEGRQEGQGGRQPKTERAEHNKTPPLPSSIQRPERKGGCCVSRGGQFWSRLLPSQEAATPQIRLAAMPAAPACSPPVRQPSSPCWATACRTPWASR